MRGDDEVSPEERADLDEEARLVEQAAWLVIALGVVTLLLGLPPWQVLLRSMPRHFSFRLQGRVRRFDEPAVAVREAIPWPCARVKQLADPLQRLSDDRRVAGDVDVLEIAPHVRPARDLGHSRRLPVGHLVKQSEAGLSVGLQKPGRAARLGLARAGRQNGTGVSSTCSFSAHDVVGRLRPAVRPTP